MACWEWHVGSKPCSRDSGISLLEIVMLKALQMRYGGQGCALKEHSLEHLSTIVEIVRCIDGHEDG